MINFRRLISVAFTALHAHSLRRWGVSLLLLFCFGVSGCGYNIAGFGGSMPGGITTLSIPVFSNHTGKPDIEAVATTLFAEEFRSIVEVTDGASATLEGRILSYNLKAVSYTAEDINLEYRLTVKFGLKMVMVETGAVIWEDANVVDYEDFIVDTSNVTVTEEAEVAAFNKLVKDTARTVKERMLDNF